jgi:hypothetical protein
MYNKEKQVIMYGRRGMNEEKVSKEGKNDSGSGTRQEEIKPQ